MTPLHKSLHSAAALAVAHGNSVGEISIDHWSRTFAASVEDVRKAFEIASARASLTACPSGEFDGK